MKFISTIVGGLIIGLVVVACGGGDSSDRFAPRAISEEHQGLSLKQLESMSSGISFDELIGHPGEGIFFDRNNPRIKDNIEEHIDTLLHYVGQVDLIYPSQDKSRYSLWLCPKHGDESDELSETTSDTDYNCRESVFLLYDPTRGPELSEGDVIEVVGILTSSARKDSPDENRGQRGHGNFSYHPTVSVIKATMSNQ